MIATENQPLVARALIGGEWRSPEIVSDLIDPYRGDLVGNAPVSTLRDCDDALGAAVLGARHMARMPGYERAALLRRMADLTEARAPAIGNIMARETGKAIRDCITEVARSADTLRLCAEEAVRIEGEHVPMDASATGAGKIGMVMRFPVGVVAAITPFNGPVNLAAHKLGPALAAGNAIVMKPSPKAPLSFHLFIEAAVDAGVPKGAVNTLFGDAVGPAMISDPRVDFVTFTGSIPVGKMIRQSAGMKRVALELGGVGPTFVHSDADLAAAAKACARNGVLLAGQSCVSVQNVYVARTAFDAFLDMVEREIRTIRFGDPLDPETDVGTMIDTGAAIRVEDMIRRAQEAGAHIHCGGDRTGAQLSATLLSRTTAAMDIVAGEVFGPALNVMPYDAIEPVFEAISASPYGLQCGIFTNSLDLALKAFRCVRTGGVIVNATSRWRSDQMPYGGVKDSGIGREGPKYAIRDMTEERLLVIN
jgi:acyl-CoA reductase-like NAD-dependent aldehyde dehydrogenase